MLSGKVTVVNALGLHARAAAQLVKLATPFKSCISLVRVDPVRQADAKSILSILTLAAVHGTELELTVEGSDELTAFSAVEAIFKNGFGELI